MINIFAQSATMRNFVYNRAMPIRLLSEDIASQIAAGEVVERPASVVKELLENALDAGAKTITVDIEGGGRNLIRVADDGCGIPAADVELAFARHATSKITSAADLFSVRTLGFRGEALASIASVSRASMITRAADERDGTQIKFEGSALLSRGLIGAPQGTLVTVENLFFNVPARLKFLKSETSERGHISTLVTRYAMAYPSVRFRLNFDNRTAFQSSGNGGLREVLTAAYGIDIARQLLEIAPPGQIEFPAPEPPPAPEDEGDEWPSVLRERPLDVVTVSGFISPPALNRSNRKEITLFVNGRWVQDIRLSTAVMQAYHTMLMVGRYPIALIMISVPTGDVDVNVHPTKAEVRFRKTDQIFSAVERAVRRTLVNRAPVPQIEPMHWSSGAVGSGQWAEASDQPIFTDIPPKFDSASAPVAYHQPTASSQPLAATLQQPLPSTSVPLLRVIGQIGAAYIVAEGPDGLYLIDQHAAHERVLYEAFSLQRAAADIVSQSLLDPVAVEVPPSAADLLNAQIETLNRIGFSIEPFGGSTFLVRSLPSVLGKVDPARAVRVVVEDFEEDETVLAAEVEARLIARVCKRAAVKAGQVLTPVEQVELVRRLEACQSPRTCPHGRPTMIHLSVETLEKQFGRKG
ncbi:MAG TPA: DNA mismatch repair endonuclease MutL [Anaerolineales bacterium]|nr:DNA mismatch repair endonuclease MutL [Anaerolineales bacterium]